MRLGFPSLFHLSVPAAPLLPSSSLQAEKSRQLVFNLPGLFFALLAPDKPFQQRLPYDRPFSPPSAPRNSTHLIGVVLLSLKG